MKRAYFFLAFPLVDVFLADFEAAFFVAIVFTTFHAVRDLTVALTWQNSPDRSGKLSNERGESAVGCESASRCPFMTGFLRSFLTIMFFDD